MCGGWLLQDKYTPLMYAKQYSYFNADVCGGHECVRLLENHIRGKELKQCTTSEEASKKTSLFLFDEFIPLLASSWIVKNFVRLFAFDDHYHLPSHAFV